MRHRERIITLTQAEIMLVLAVVILLLLAAKNSDLTAAHANLNDAREKIAALQSKPTLGEETPPEEKTAAATDITPPDPDAPITAPLVPGGEPPQPSQPLGEEKAQTPAGKPKTEKNQEELLRDLQLQNAQFENEIKRLENENTALEEKIADLTAPRTPAEKEPDAETPDETPPAAISQTAKELRDEIGFVPCWLGPGTPRYYFTYNITYFPGKDKFRIAPHRDLQSNAPVVRNAINGELALINHYPKGEISRGDFLRFAQSVRAAQKRQYGENGCRLAATINKRGVDLTVTNDFIFSRIGFYPVGRTR